MIQRLSSLTVDELDRLVPRAATVDGAEDLFDPPLSLDFGPVRQLAADEA